MLKHATRHAELQQLLRGLATAAALAVGPAAAPSHAALQSARAGGARCDHASASGSPDYPNGGRYQRRPRLWGGRDGGAGGARGGGSRFSETAWAELGAHPALFPGLRALGAAAPTPVQQAGAPAILARQSVALQSPTGSGKTLAFMVPLLSRALRRHEQWLLEGGQKPREWGGLEALVVAPSQELAMQIVRAARALLPQHAHTAVQQLIGGANPLRQALALSGKLRRPVIGVGTPGRLCRLMSARLLKFSRDLTIVLDEADDLYSNFYDTHCILECLALEQLPGKLRAPAFVEVYGREKARFQRERAAKELRRRGGGGGGAKAGDAAGASGGGAGAGGEAPALALPVPRPLPHRMVLVGATLTPASVEAIGQWCEHPIQFISAPGFEDAAARRPRQQREQGRAQQEQQQRWQQQEQGQWQQQEGGQQQQQRQPGQQEQQEQREGQPAEQGPSSVALSDEQAAAAPPLRMLPSSATHYYYPVPPGAAASGAGAGALQRLLAAQQGKGRRVLAFARSGDDVTEAARKLESGMEPGGPNTWQVLTLHGDMPPAARRRALEEFANPGPQRKVLILTDVGAAGLDLPLVHAVLQLGPPPDWRTYVRRAGRAARRGAGGWVVTAVEPGARARVEAIARRAGVELQELRPR